jgi:hypothetical protein
VLQAIRQNGINQQEYVTKNPSLGSSGGSEAAPTTYAIAPNLKAPLRQRAQAVQHQFEDQQVVRARTRIERGGGNGMLGDRRVVVARGVDRQGVWEAASGPAA